MSQIKKLAHKLKVKPWKIKKENIKYYYTKYPQRCCDYEHSPIKDIEKFKYSDAINILKDYYKDIKCDYYNNLYKKSIKYDNRPLPSDISDPEIAKTIDDIMCEYAKFRKDLYTIIMWPRAKGKTQELNNILNEYGNICYIKKFNISYKAAINLLYQIYADQPKLSKKHFIEEKLKFMHWEKNKRNTFRVIFYEHSGNKQISGKHAPLKEDIRNLWKDDDNFWGRDYVHINDFYYQTIEYCKIFLNRNSMKLLQFQDHNNFTNHKLLKCRYMINTTKNWMTKNISPIDYERFIFLGSASLYAHGIRLCSDLDGYVSAYPKESQTKEFHKLIDVYFRNEKTKFFFADLGITDKVEEQWDEKNKIWFDKINVNHVDDLIFDPKNHFYYNGIKFITIKHEITRKMLRGNFKDYCDFLQIEKTLGIKIDLPKIPEKYKDKGKFMKLIDNYIKYMYPNVINYEDRIKKLIN